MLSNSEFIKNNNQEARDEKENDEGDDGINKVLKEFLSLMREVTCPICLSVVESPVLTPCNHLFCKECILRALRPRTNDDSQHIDIRPKHQSCPLCKLKCSARGLLESPSIVTRLIEKISAIREAFIQDQGGVSLSQFHTRTIENKKAEYDTMVDKEEEIIQLELPSSTGDDVFRPIDEIIGQNDNDRKTNYEFCEPFGL